MKMKEFIILFSITGLFFFASIYLVSNLLVMRGALKERAEKECVSAVAITNWEKTLDIAQAICVETRDDYKNDIKTQYEARIKDIEKNAKYWKDSYFWLKKQKE